MERTQQQEELRMAVSKGTGQLHRADMHSQRSRGLHVIDPYSQRCLFLDPGLQDENACLT